MTENSRICNFIAEHPDNWRELLAEKQIKVKENSGYAIFNYEVMADFSDPVVQEARGIIIDTKTLDVAAWPFRKFGNSHESYADSIDWDSAKVQEKLDGSIIKLWYDEYESWRADECWRWSSNSCIDAKDAKLSSGWTINTLIRQTDEWKYLQNLILNNELDPQNTYIFELVGPKNQVVIKYDKTQLFHIGTRDNVTGKELGTGQFAEFIMSPREYPLHSLDDCLAAAKELNKGDYPDNEGFVVVDKDYHRVKVKAPEYLIYHHMVNNGQITKERAYEILNSDDFNLDTFIKSVPEYIADVILYYKSELDDAKEEAIRMIGLARQLRENGSTRKEIAEAVKNDDYSYFGFKALDTDMPAEDIIRQNEKKLFHIIKEYEPEFEERNER